MTTDELMTILSGPPVVVDADGRDYPVVRDYVTCKDGFGVSIQASANTINAERWARHNDGGYSHFEIGNPSSKDELLTPFESLGGIFVYVPFCVVESLIDKHGGPAPECDGKNFGALSVASQQGEK